MANKFAKDNEAVSAVIGVILMVAITVILAAVIAAFVFGMGQNVKKTYTVAITATRPNADKVSITNMGGNDVGKLMQDGTALSVVIGDSATPETLTSLTYDVGSSESFDAAAPTSGSGTHVVVTGHFQDGVAQVLLDTYV